MKQIIQLKDKGKREHIKKAFGLLDSNLGYALNFARNTEKDIKIRLAAMKNGGKLLREVENWNINDLKNK